MSSDFVNPALAIHRDEFVYGNGRLGFVRVHGFSHLLLRCWEVRRSGVQPIEPMSTSAMLDVGRTGERADPHIMRAHSHERQTPDKSRKSSRRARRATACTSPYGLKTRVTRLS